MRRWILFITAGVAALIVVVVMVGYMLPVGHSASRTVTLPATPDRVFLVITDFQSYPEWRSDVERIEVSGGPGEGQLVREVGSNGEIPYRVDELIPPSRMVMRIDATDLPFGGSWTYELSPAPSGGTSLTLTEDGEVYNPIFRFMSRFAFGYLATIDAYLVDLQAHLAAG